MQDAAIMYEPHIDTDVLWKQYAIHVDLYKFYLDVTIKAVAFSYAITGGIVSYVLAKDAPNVVVFALILPIIMSAALAGTFVYAACLVRHVRSEMFAIRDRLGLKVAPDVGVLSIVLRVFASVLVMTAIGLSWFAIIRWP